jgi:long-chain acyl-CoA synthetase
MEANPKNIFTIKVEDGKPRKDGQPAVGPVFRSSLAKDGFPPLEPDMQTSWDVFRYTAEIIIKFTSSLYSLAISQ